VRVAQQRLDAVRARLTQRKKLNVTPPSGRSSSGGRSPPLADLQISSSPRRAPVSRSDNRMRRSLQGEGEELAARHGSTRAEACAQRGAVAPGSQRASSTTFSAAAP